MQRLEARVNGRGRCCALIALAALAFVLTGCEKEPEPQPDPYVPDSYMKDPVFRKGLDDRNAAQKRIVAERAKLVRRMEELVRAHGENEETLRKIPEWNELHRKVTELNARYEEGRRDLLRYARERITPKGGAAPAAAKKPISK